MKISILGAGNVGSLTALRIAQEGLGEVLLIDIVKGLAQGKAYDLEDAKSLLKRQYTIEGTDDIRAIEGSDIVVITAGLARKPGMTREELLLKNASILKDVALTIKEKASKAVVVVVTNPLDLMTHFVLKVCGFTPGKVLGMGISLDASRFANLISKELGIAVTQIEALVIGAHGEGMLPLVRFTTVGGVSLDELLSSEKIDALIKRTILRGQELVSLLGAGSAYFAPSAAIMQIVKAISKDEKRIFGACAYLNGEYGLRDVCIGVPCRIGRQGIEDVIELELSTDEKEKFLASAASLSGLIQQLPF